MNKEQIPFEPTQEITREDVMRSVENTPDKLLQQKATQCCNAIVIHGEGVFRCSMCGTPIITSTGAVHPNHK